jgi:pimeloyl-ACP methyl ester carboxylesterase
MADDAVAVIDGLGWQSAHIVGHSMGSMIAQTLAINHRDQVRSLICISSTPSPDIGRMRPLTMLGLLRVNPAALNGRAPRSAAEAGEWMVRGHRVIGSPGYPLDEAWLRHIGELMYARGGFDRAARGRQGAAIQASGDRRPALRTLHNQPWFSMARPIGSSDPRVGVRPLPRYQTPNSFCFPAWAKAYQKHYGPISLNTSELSPTWGRRRRTSTLTPGHFKLTLHRPAIHPRRPLRP